MGYRYNWLLVLFVIVIPLPVQVLAFWDGTVLAPACYNESWAYHSPTYTCFGPYWIPRNWPGARDHCAGIELGKNFGVVTHLAKIDDSDTHDFIRENVFYHQGWRPLIGLHETNGEFRWDGYPDETPKFTHSIWEYSTRPYVAMHYSKWIGRNADEIRHFVCQHDAKKILGPITCDQQPEVNRLDITCRSSQSPVKAKCQWTYKYLEESTYGPWTQVPNPTYESHTDNPESDVFHTTTCSFTLSHMNPGIVKAKINMYPDISDLDLSENEKAATVKWLEINVEKPREATFVVFNKKVNEPDVNLVQGSDDVIITCVIDTGNPTVTSITMSCDDPITSEITIQDAVTTSYGVVIRQVRRDMDGHKCTCSGQHLTGQTDDSTLTLKVLTKPTMVTCQTDLRPDRLLFSCQTDKIFPQALCTISYRNQGGTSFLTLSSNTDIDIQYSHDSYSDNDGILYYRSDCSVSLTPDLMTFSPGDLKVQVTVNPNIEGIDQDTTSDAFVTTRKTVNIVKPQARFMVSDINVNGPDVILVQGSDDVIITCVIDTGDPAVSSTTMSCDAPITNEINTQDAIVTPTSYKVVIGQVKGDMDGWKCTCWGEHLTGQTEDSTLNFSVVKKILGPITCDQQKEANRLDITCRSSQSPVKAKCQWTYKYLEDSSFRPWSQVPKPTYESHTGNTGSDVSYTTTCSFTLSNLNPGIVKMKLNMYPDVSGLDLSENGKAATVKLLEINIDTQPKCPVCSSTSSLSTGTLVGLILASNVLVIILTIIAMMACIKLRKKNKNTPKSKQDGVNGHVNVAFHKPKTEQTTSDSGYVEVPDDAMFPRRAFQPPTGNQSEDLPYEGEEMEIAEEVKYQTINDAERERRKGENYDILHRDDPNYANLKRDPLRRYETIQPGEEGAGNAYLTPKPTDSKIEL